MSPIDPVELQQKYYAKVASKYNSAFAFDPEDEHYIACAILTGLIQHYQIDSLLDVGCGTGRAISYLSKSLPSLQILGVEPVAEMRQAAIEAGIPSSLVHPGDATALPFRDQEFDCCSAFGVLHHVVDPKRAIREMFRVSRKAIFISDHNVYGMGSLFTRSLKQSFRDLHARWLLRLLLTGGKGFHDTDWDGIFYPFSLIDHLELIRSLSTKIHLFPTRRPGLNIYRQTSHLAVLAII
jgi:ubiquinone/menaquinone biosynthesis C-methylase UbiE